MSINLALLGAGRIGIVHARAIASDPRAILVAVADPMEKAANNIAEKARCEIMTIDEIASASHIDGVIICTPTHTHADLIELFARAGKAIFCEKPIDLNMERAKACIRVVNQCGAKFMLAFNRRFDPHFVALKQAVSEGAIGEVEMVQITSRDPGAPDAAYIKSSGGIFKDMTIHDFDMARFLLPDEPVGVFATASILTDPAIAKLGDFDSASIILTTASGRQCTINNSRRATYGYDQRIEVHGSKGMVAAQNQRPVSIEIANKKGFTRPPLHNFFMTRYIEAYAAEISSFIDAMVENSELSPGPFDGLKALSLAEAALISCKSGRQEIAADISIEDIS